MVTFSGLAASAAEFFRSPGGIALFVVVAVAIVIFVLDANYRYFGKRLFDFLAALVCVMVCSPLYLALAIAGRTAIRKRGTGRILSHTRCLSRHGATVLLTSYSLVTFGGERLGGYADFLERSRLVSLPRLLDVLTGKISFIGVRILPVRDRGFIEDEDYERFDARAGLITPLVFGGGPDLKYEEVFALERRYAKKCGLFRDIGILFKSLIVLSRGDRGNVLGEAERRDYCDVLLERGEITPEQLEAAETETF